jgi:hypothetical protein
MCPWVRGFGISLTVGSAKANGRQPKSCLGQVLHCKLVRFCFEGSVLGQHPSLKLKTRFVQLGLNEADAIKPSSILIY